MTWVKLSDTFAEDPRLDEAGPLALALHVAALCYCGRQLTDGRLPRGTMRRLQALDDPDAVAARLVAVGMWREMPDGFELVDYLRDQPSREHVEAVRAKRAAAGRTGGIASGVTRRSNSEASTKQSASRVLEPRPVPKTGRVRARENDRARCPNGAPMAADGSCCGLSHGEAAS